MEVHVEVAAETLFKLGPVPVTNSMLTMFIIMGGIILVSWLIARSLKEIPGRGQGFYEVVVEFLLGLVESSAGSKKTARTVFPLIGAIFIFIAISNYSGLLPGVGVFGHYHAEEAAMSEGEHPTSEEGASVQIASASTGVQNDTVTSAEAEAAPHEAHKVLVPWLRAPNADINMTLAMALVTFSVVQIAGIKAHGVRGRIKHMATPAFIFPIEVISEFSRIISLSARLFGNVFAGEVLLGVMYAMASAIKIAVIPLALPVIFLFLELMFGTIQALVFALLTLIYIALAMEGGHGDDEHEHGHAPAHGATAGAHGD